jgi:hypothetical protein
MIYEIGRERGSSVDMVTRYVMEVSDFQIRCCRKSFLLSMPGQTLAQPRVRWVPEPFPGGKTARTWCCPPIPHIQR